MFNLTWVPKNQSSALCCLQCTLLELALVVHCLLKGFTAFFKMAQWVTQKMQFSHIFPLRVFAYSMFHALVFLFDLSLKGTILSATVFRSLVLVCSLLHIPPSFSHILPQLFCWDVTLLPCLVLPCGASLFLFFEEGTWSSHASVSHNYLG